MQVVTGKDVRKIIEDMEDEDDFMEEDECEDEDDFVEEDESEESEESTHHSKVTGVLINVTSTKKASVETIDNDLQSYYDILECSCFDIVSLKIGEHRYDVYCDDEALLKENPIVSAINHNLEPMLTNNLFVTLTDEDGETISLSEENIKEVMDNVKGMFDFAIGDSKPILICEYY